jgi:PAS domain S-box-containing protein
MQSMLAGVRMASWNFFGLSAFRLIGRVPGGFLSDIRNMSSAESFLAGGGEMAARMSAHDWSASLGPIASWPQSLKTTVSLMVHSPVPLVLLWGEDGIMLYNDAYSIFAGRRHPQLLGSKVREGWPEVADFNDNVMRVGLAGGTLSYKDRELTLNRRGQMEAAWMDLFYSPVIDESGKPGGVIAVVVETTEQMMNARNLAESEQRLQTALSAGRGIGTWDWNVQQDRVVADERFARLYGVDPKRAKAGAPLAEFFNSIHPDDSDRVMADVQLAMKTGGRFNSVYRLRQPDGSVRWVEAEGQCTLDTQGQPLRFPGVSFDVSDRIEAQSALRESESRYQSLFTSIDAGFCIFEMKFDEAGKAVDYRFLEVNPAFKAQTGLDDAAGKWMRDLAPAHEQHWFDIYGEVAKTGRQVRFQNHAEALGDRWFEVTAFRVGEPGAYRVAALFEDVSTRMRAEIILQQNEARLRFLDALSRETTGSLDADTILSTTTRMLGQHLDVSICAYADMDEDQNGFTIRDDWSAPGSSSVVGHYRMADFGELAVEKMFANLPLIINDNRTELPPDEAAAFQSIGATATICIPLVKDGRLTALMAIHDKNPRAWTVADQSLLTEVAERSWAHIERVRAAAELKSSDAQFGTMAQAMPNHVWTAPPDGMLDWFNQQVYVYSGIAPGTLDGTGWTGMVHPDDIGVAAAQWAKSLTSGDIYETEFRLRRADGVYRWHLARAVPIKDEHGTITRWIGTNTDIQYQTESAAALHDLNAELESKVIAQSLARGRTWQLSPDIIGVLNSEGYFETSNPAWQIVLGWSEREIAATVFFDFIHPDDQAKTHEAWEAAMGRGEPALRFENRYRHKDGSYRWLSWVAVPDGGKIYCSARDVTAEKEQEAQLARAEEALRQSQKMEAVGQLTGGIAHDFNNLLQGITGALDRVQHRIAQGRTGDVERFLKAAIESANRAGALTHRLLAFSRRQTLDPRPTDANRLIGGMEELVRRTVGPNITVEVVGAGGLWPIRVDPSQVENSLLNLCINARDAMPDGGTLTIETANKWLDERAAREREVPPGQYVSLCVTDTGTGMTPEVIARAFDPFFTTKPLGQGTGLGLSMIYGFVRQSGGQVRIYSEIGKGTTMCLYFPRYAGKVEDEAAAVSELVERGFGETVLVVDDEPTVRMLVAEVLSESYYNIIEAGDGPSALKILESDRRIDLMITDVGLPGGMNGRQVADAARVLRKDLKVLFITGYAENAAVGNGHLDAGMEILAKPFAMSTLANKVREMIER